MNLRYSQQTAVGQEPANVAGTMRLCHIISADSLYEDSDGEGEDHAHEDPEDEEESRHHTRHPGMLRLRHLPGRSRQTTRMSLHIAGMSRVRFMLQQNYIPNSKKH